MFQSISCKNKCIFRSASSEGVYQVSVRRHSKSARRKQAKFPKNIRRQTSKQNFFDVFKRTSWKPGSNVLASEKRLEIIKSFFLPSLAICVDTDQFLLVPASVNQIKSLGTQTYTKQQVPKYHAEQNLRYRNNSSEKEIKRSLQSRFFIQQNLFGLSIKHSKLQNSQLEGV